ncbi:MAG: MarR family transcriptional regulator, partial [Actinobacteria bacterium]|nr:MarR family transcriptional regulator [Actinomycetota bacterium]
MTRSSATAPGATDVASGAPEGLVEVADRLRLSTTRLARLLRQQSDYDLTPTQLAALATLQRCGPVPVGTLADVEQVSAPTATKVVGRLHASGLVERRPDPTDRRVSLVAVTPAGEALLAEIRARKTAWLTRRLGQLPAAELERVVDALDVLEHLTPPPP